MMSDTIKHTTPDLTKEFNRHYHPTVGELIRKVHDHKQSAAQIKAIEDEKTEALYEVSDTLEQKRHERIQEAAREMFERQTAHPEYTPDGSEIQLSSPEDCVPFVIDKVDAQITGEIQAVSQHYTDQQTAIVEQVQEQRVIVQNTTRDIEADYKQKLRTHRDTFEATKHDLVAAAAEQGIEKPESHVCQSYKQEQQAIKAEQSSAISAAYDSHGFDAPDHSMTNSISI